MADNIQLIATVLGIVSIIITILLTAKHSERVSEKRLVRIETFLMLCCNKLEIPIDEINNG